ncbi:hybrid sensor histidine kinase/response regulator transcription factor [Mucilaginibacter psychrotolerans]|uniref:histidine kinase n=1 Tax=Mucilaginibacter psychrotolerans TaxID=1524096 RepID=A0A4Y8SF52_9SPHI|nr:two-component regulator propeller domain-containing protein [Mucilaginibacter psychrotolerans]TFF37532.1 response regulator [Mucilaginibacter psychrotolerans]
MHYFQLFSSRKASSFLLFQLSVIAITLFAYPRNANAQEIKFTAITSRDGLSSNTVNAILKDDDGYMWFATPEGVDRFNGKDIKVYGFHNAGQGSVQANEAASMYKDRLGRIWVGTVGGGLYFYDKLNDRFASYPGLGRQGGVTNPNQYIRTICGDYSGKLWLGKIDGITILDTAAKTTRRFLPAGRHGGQQAPENILCLFEDRQHRMWIGTSTGLHLFNPATGSFATFTHDKNNVNSIGSDKVNTVTQSADGRIWVGTFKGLTCFSADLKTSKSFNYSPSDNRTLSGNLVYNIAVADANKLWIGTEGGLDIMDMRTGLVQRFKHDDREVFSINSKSIRCLYLDPCGIYWLGTYEGGVNKYDRSLTLFDLKQNNGYDAKSLSNPVVTSLVEGKQDQIYVGTDGGGLNVFDTKTRLFSHVDIRPREKINSAGLPILCMALDGKEQLWLGTFQNGLFVYNTNNGSYKQLKAGSGASDISSNEIFCLKYDSKGQMWVGTNGNGLNKYDPATGTFRKYEGTFGSLDQKSLPLNGYIRAIEEDREGNIWIGSVGTGIAILNPKTQKFKLLNFANTGMAIERVFSLLQDSRGNMWIGTSGDGLFCYNIATGKLKSYSTANGLASGVIHKILEDNHGNIWVSTNKGVSSFNAGLKQITNYSKYNGLQDAAFSDGAGLKHSNGSLFFGGGGGLNYIDPAKDVKFNRNPPPVYLTGLQADNKVVTPGKDAPIASNIAVAQQLRLRYKQDFALSYNAVNFTIPEQNSYAYKLVGFNTDWNYVGTATTAYFTNLNPGEYTFMVKAANNNGIWSEEVASIHVSILAPFWMTWYAYIAYALIVLATLLFIRHLGIKKVKMKLAVEQERKMAEEMHRVDMMKVKFVTNLSHEFRTPISLILAPTDKLLAHHNDRQTTKQLAVIKRNSHRLLNLVDEMLDLRKIEEHEMKLNLADGEISSFIKEVVDSFYDLSESKDIQLHYEGLQHPLFVKFDADKIERILLNLLSNAFKFTPAGGKVRVEILEIPGEGAKSAASLAIKVTDNGIGIEKENLTKIFNRFFQGENLSGSLNQGSGIGLSIAKEFAEMHGGRILVESKPGQGAVFTVMIDLKRFDAQPATAAPIAAAENLLVLNGQDDDPIEETKANAPSKLRVLIIEDNAELRSYIKENLKRCFKVDEAADGKEGWEKVLSFHPDLVVSDISMPHMDGITLTGKIKADKRTCQIPVILLTALTGDKQQLLGLETGANDYLTKPFNFDILNLKIKNLLSQNSILKNTYSKQLKVTPESVEVESSGEKFLSNAINYIEKNLTKPKFSIVDLSEHLGMSRGALYNKIFALTGQPPVEFIRSYKLDRAAFLLLKSDMTVSQIAYEAGFGTPHYFSKSFKNKFDVLPSEYRKMVVKEDALSDTPAAHA